jgi:hypothetical protein
MRILILEDNLDRIEFFKRIYKNHTLYITDNLLQAKTWSKYKEIDFDIMFLDHDIKENIFTAMKEEDTGYDFVKWLVEGKIQIHALYYIHSMNPVGAQVMVNTLKDNGYQALWVPFHLLTKEDR